MQLFSFSYGETKYEVELSLDDAAIMENSLAFEVIAVATKNGEKTPLAARIELFPWESRGTATINGNEVFAFDLSDRGHSWLEQLIQSVPVPDPVLGCALKAGISSIIGQAAKCRDTLESDGRWGQIREFFSCMRQKLGSIALTALKRAFGCMISGGLL